MAGLYGISEGYLGATPRNWAGHPTLPDFLRDDQHGQLGYADQRPDHMRGGFYPEHLAMEQALGSQGLGSVEPQPKYYYKKSLGEAIRDKLNANPVLKLGAGILIGVVIMRWLKG